MRKLISVTQEDINNGNRMNSGTCPVAIALNRNCPHYPQGAIRAGFDEVYYWDNNKPIHLFKTPRSVSRFISKFDKNGKAAVKPFNFYIPS